MFILVRNNFDCFFRENDITFLLETLPILPKICNAFPILIEEITNFLYGNKHFFYISFILVELYPSKYNTTFSNSILKNPHLLQMIQEIFQSIIKKLVIT